MPIQHQAASAPGEDGRWAVLCAAVEWLSATSSLQPGAPEACPDCERMLQLDAQLAR